MKKCYQKAVEENPNKKTKENKTVDMCISHFPELKTKSPLFRATI